MYNYFRYSQAEAPQNKICDLVKQKLSEDVAVQALFSRFEIDPQRLEELNIQIVDLEGRFAETDEQNMSLDKELFEGGVAAFFQDHYFIVVHELVHWLSRIKESEAYFNDPEEVLGFVAAAASEIQRGVDLDVIWNKIYPKIEFHFHDNNDAQEFFVNLIEKAKQLLAS